MPDDAARIQHSWDTTAARWRFEAHRRNMLLRALAASGADNDLLSQLGSTLFNLDSHALAVALRKLNASYARRTRDLDKARAQIAALRSEVDEA
jgi:septal ring factor EnvC (AmiA/AmiB activator)